MKYIISPLSIFLLLATSCNNDTNVEEVITDSPTEIFIDDPNAEVTAADTSTTGVYQEEVDESSETSLQEAMQANSSTTTESESGLSFCDCVKKQKKLLDLVEETEDDEILLKAMEDLNNMKTGECKILFEGNQNTIEDQENHERKVKKCLNQK